jgi:dUTP pyrophosphatase
MNMKSLFPKEGPKMDKEKDANFSVLEIQNMQIFIAKEEDKDLVETTNDWLTKNGYSWNDVGHYYEKKLDPKEVEKLTRTQGFPEILVKYVAEGIKEIEVNPFGNFVDLRSAEDIDLKKGDFHYLDLGVAIKLPQGYWGQLVARSSLFKNFGLIQTNGFGVIDTTYCGEEDIWKLPVYATRDTHICKNDRVAQFRIVKDQPFAINEVDHLDDKSRGGLGSSGIK